MVTAPVIDYPTTKDTDINVLSTTRERLEELQRVEQAQRGTRDDLTKLLLEGRLDAAVEGFRSQEQAGHADDEIREIAAAALFTQGQHAVGLARQSADPSEIERLLRMAEMKYAQALRAKPNMHEAVNDWGNTLAERARRASKLEERAPLFQAAEAKYEGALRIKPDYHDALTNWGNVLLERAQQTSDPKEATCLFQAAEAKYEAALRVKPDRYDVLANWGNALAGRARQASNLEEAVPLFQAAEAKYEAALASDLISTSLSATGEVCWRSAPGG
jgi:Tfp pilus assembly protein PilF